MSDVTNTYEPAAVATAEWPVRLAALCALRDAVNAANVPAEALLTRLNAEIEERRVQAEKVAAAIDDRRGRMKWIEMKREIRVLTKALG
jgi:hypothetical protein